MEPKKIQVEYIEGTKDELIVRKLNVKERNTLLYKYLDLNSVMSQTGNINNIVEVVRSDKNVLEFMEETVRTCVNGIKIDNIDGKECDRIFNDIFEYSVGIGENSKN